jgi:CxxC motif-containing protein
MSKQMDERKFTCIICPLGCEVTIKLDKSGGIKETIGNKCPKGEKYAAGEFKAPTRVLTSTIAIEGAPFARLPVRTSGFIPKDRIFDCMKEIRKAKVKAPVGIGDIIIKGLMGTDVIASRCMK